MSYRSRVLLGALPAGLLLAACTTEAALPAPVRESLGAQAELPYSEAVRYGDTYYFSGKVGATDSTRAMQEGRTAAEARNVLEAFRGALERNGLGFEDVVNATVYLTDINAFAEMNAVYREYFPSDPPARGRHARPSLSEAAMAKTESFDVTTGVDMQEVDNAVNQARKEIEQRYDFKGTRCTFDFDRAAGTIVLEADDAYRLEALKGVLREKLARRKVPLKNLDEGTVEDASLGRARQRIGLKQGIDQETAKKISKDVRDEGFKKVQVQIQGDQLRVSSPSRNILQEVIAFLRARDYGVELKFGNYR